MTTVFAATPYGMFLGLKGPPQKKSFFTKIDEIEINAWTDGHLLLFQK